MLADAKVTIHLIRYEDILWETPLMYVREVKT